MVKVAALLVACMALLLSAQAAVPEDTAVLLEWRTTILQAIKPNTAEFGPPGVARALAIATTCMFDAFAPYTEDVVATLDNGIIRAPAEERTSANRRKAVSRAAYVALRGILGNRQPGLADAEAILAAEGVDKDDEHMSSTDPIGIANKACGAVLEFRKSDGMNSEGDEATGATLTAYSDFTNYAPVNDAPPASFVTRSDCANIRDMRKWTPLRIPTATEGVSATQSFAIPWMGFVTPFAITVDRDLLPPPPPMPNSVSHDTFMTSLRQVIDYTSTLDDYQKAIAEFWADGPKSYLPPGHWYNMAGDLCEIRELPFHKCMSALFLVGNAVFDSGIATWFAKRWYDGVRPITAAQCLLADEDMLVWQGPYRGLATGKGADWVPYQSPTFVTPPFAEYTSGHSGFSAAAAEVLKSFFGSDDFNYSYTIKAGESLFEPRVVDENDPRYVANYSDVANTGIGTIGYSPASDIVLNWATFSDAAEEAGVSRIYGGIHFNFGNVEGLKVGRKVGKAVYEKYLTLVDPVAREAALSSSSSSSSSSYLSEIDQSERIFDSFYGSLLAIFIVNLIFAAILYSFLSKGNNNQQPAKRDRQDQLEMASSQMELRP